MIFPGDTTHVKEISNTKLLVSLNHYYANFASMEIFDVSKRDRPEKIYSFEEVSGGNIDSHPIPMKP